MRRMKPLKTVSCPLGGLTTPLKRGVNEKLERDSISEPYFDGAGGRILKANCELPALKVQVGTQKTSAGVGLAIPVQCRMVCRSRLEVGS